MFAKPSCDNVLQPSPLRGSGCNTLPHSGLANVNIRKRMFYPLITLIMNKMLVAFAFRPLAVFIHAFSHK